MLDIKGDNIEESEELESENNEHIPTKKMKNKQRL